MLLLLSSAFRRLTSNYLMRTYLANLAKLARYIVMPIIQKITASKYDYSLLDNACDM